MIETIAKLTKKCILQNNIVSFTLQSDISKIAKPGQFIDILVEGCILRRPFSICEIFQNEIKIYFQIRGKGTKIMASWNVGKQINILGPLGNGFNLSNQYSNMLIIGGGIGCFALLELAKRYSPCHIVLGFKSATDVILNDDFARYGKIYIYTQDGSFGQKGLPTDNILNIINDNKIDRIACCGPVPMMKAVTENVKQLNNIFCELCLEEKMACGIGACLGCQCRIKHNDKIESKHVCCDGPVFEAKEVMF